MHLARGAVVLEDADVVDAVPRFTPIADPPHGSVLPNTIVASPESARNTHRADDRSLIKGRPLNGQPPPTASGTGGPRFKSGRPDHLILCLGPEKARFAPLHIAVA